MNETEFKTLMFCFLYVDANKLEKGIYTCESPFIYPKDDTIEDMTDRAKRIKDMNGECFFSKQYFDNLKQCELVKITIKQ